MKKEMLNISDDEIKPYFNVDSVQINGVFYAAHRVYGLNFKQRKDIPTYHPDMKVFEVSDKSGKPIALFYSDYFRRPTKRGGAWMSAFAKQSDKWGQLPIIYNVCNNAKAPEGQPTLITWDEVCTMFHEFGHALHGMLSKCGYNTFRAQQWLATSWKCHHSLTSHLPASQKSSITTPVTLRPVQRCQQT